MKAIFSPGPAYSNPDVIKYAGWWHILTVYREALEELGYEVFIPQVPPELIDQSSTVSKILSYDVVAASQLPTDADLFLGPPGYSLAQIMRLKGHFGCENTKVVLYAWNNQDWWRDQQLAEEYKRRDVPYDLSPTWRWINRTALEMTDHVIACSPWVKKTHSKVVPESKISIAFWGVASQMFTPAKEDPPGYRVLFVGGDPVRKGLIYLLEAFEKLRATVPEAELWVVGAPVNVRVPNVVVKGMIPYSDMPALMRQAHVLVCPTLEDGIALCVQEAMASGLAVVGTPEVAEVFENGLSGLMVHYRDPDHILKALMNLADPQSRQMTAIGARALAETQTWTKTKEDVKEIIRRVMNGSNLPFESEMPWLK